MSTGQEIEFRGQDKRIWDGLSESGIERVRLAQHPTHITEKRPWPCVENGHETFLRKSSTVQGKWQEIVTVDFLLKGKQMLTFKPTDFLQILIANDRSFLEQL